MGTYGTSYDRTLDGPRVAAQMETIKRVMLSAGECNTWLTLQEIERLTRYPQSSISAQLRHLRKAAFGSYRVEKRRRGNERRGLWEYLVLPPQGALTAAG